MTERILSSDDDEAPKRWPCCPFCGASARDGTMCKNCLAFAGGEPLLVATDDVHAPSTRDKEWTLCGIWSPQREDHPVYKKQKFATKAVDIKCPLCQERIEEYKQTGIPPRMRPL